MERTSWPDRELYPFEARWLELPEGRMHYVDEGTGPPVVLVHGTPTWSFLYRGLIRELSREHRVIAPDLLGFGRSDKPEGADYRPEAQAGRLAALIEHLGLRDLAVGVHDFGGPIGLAYALDHPERVRALVLFNTWMWSLEDRPQTVRASRLFASRIGRLLYRRLNFSPRVLLPAMFADRSRLRPEVHRHYLEAFPSPRERTAPWVYARELVGSSAWYRSLWERRERLGGIPALLVWGLADPAFGEADLERWRGALPEARVVPLPGAGHFVTEEEPERVAEEVVAFLAETADAEG